MSAETAVLRGRAMAESLMTDRVLIRRVAGVVPDPMTGQDVTTYETVYEGMAKLQSYEGYEASREVIAHSTVVQRMAVHLPVGAYVVAVGDVVTIASSTMDPLLEGREFRVTQEAPYKSFATAYRIFVDYKAE